VTKSFGLGRFSALALAMLLSFGMLVCSQTAKAAATSASTATARTSSSGPAWSSLNTEQRKALGPLERDWSTIDAARKSKWLEVAARFPTMPAADQHRVQERMAEWAHMTPNERGRARLSFQESKQFSPEQKQARWEAYQALPDDERRALADRNQPITATLRPLAAGSGNGSGQKPMSTGTAIPSRATGSAPAARPVTPTVVQARPGATTTLMTMHAEPPPHHRPGEPKIAAKPGQVDRRTLLPQSGPQSAASAPRLP
jgi:hypothetical protein